MRSPTIVIVGCAVREHPKVPQIEQVIAAGAAAQNLFLAAHDLGYGVMWKTGAAAYDPDVKTPGRFAGAGPYRGHHAFGDTPVLGRRRGADTVIGREMRGRNGRAAKPT